MDGKVVVIVEDHPLVRLNAATMCQDMGLCVADCDSAEAALAYISEQRASVAAVFTDVELAGRMTGLELAATLSERWPEIVVLVTSGRIRPLESLPPGVRFVAKPWLACAVLATMRRAVTKH